MFTQKKVLFGLFLTVLMFISSHAQAANIVVNSTGDNVIQDGQCTLREAIENANNNFAVSPDCPAGQPAPVIDQIRFSLGADLVIDIIDGQFPPITDPVLIDGTTQNGTVCALDQRQLRVEVNGANGSGAGLIFGDGSDGSQVRGLVLHHFANPVIIFGADNIQVTCNNIGVNSAGDQLLGVSAQIGIDLVGENTNITIGGDDAGAGNVVAGYGSQIALNNQNNNGVVIAGNRLGVNAAGTAVLQQLTNASGIVAGNAADLRIGGTGPASGNVIAGLADPVRIWSVTDAQIQGNRIGVGANNANLGNMGSGLYISGSSNVAVGSVAAGAKNIIAYNQGAGVNVTDDSQNVSIVANSIFQNGQLGIDLNGDGVTLNDVGDSDDGSNHLLNFPVITNVNLNYAPFVNWTLTVDFHLDVDSSNTNNFRIDVYANPAGADPSNHGEGQIPFYSFTTTAGAANYTFSTNNFSGVDVSDIQFISMTATEILPNGQLGATSEFSKIKMLPHQIDFGDAPDPAAGTSMNNYRTTADDGGAYHLLDANAYLGQCVDGDTGTYQNLSATQDDMNIGLVFGTCVPAGDDEDGVTFLNIPVVGQLVKIKVITHGSGYLSAWVDYNKDGDWLDVLENAIPLTPLADGTHALVFTVPNNAITGVTYARFRYYKESPGGSRPVGPGKGGEVEDYLIKIYPSEQQEQPPVKWTPTEGSKI